MKTRWYVSVERISDSPRRFRVRVRQDRKQKEADPGEFLEEVDSLGPIRDLLEVLEPQRRSDLVIASEELFRDRDVPPGETGDARVNNGLNDLRGSAGAVHFAVVDGDWDDMASTIEWWRDEAIRPLRSSDAELARRDPPQKWKPLACPNCGGSFRLAVPLKPLPSSLGSAASCPECGYMGIHLT